MEEKEPQQLKTPLTLKLERAAKNSAVATQYCLNALQLDPERAEDALNIIKKFIDAEKTISDLNREAFKMKKEWLVQNRKEKGNVTKLPEKKPEQEDGQEDDPEQKKVV